MDTATTDPAMISAIAFDEEERLKTKVEDLQAAAALLMKHLPKAAAAVMGHAHQAAVAWSKLADPKGED